MDVNDDSDFWRDDRVRHARLVAIGEALVEGDTARLQTALRDVDAAVVEAMRAAGFPRRGVNDVLVDPLMRWGRQGEKRPTCEIALSQRYILSTLAANRDLDALVRTWVHESFHARLAFSSEEKRGAEYGPYWGYEEGLVDGLARHVMQQREGVAYDARYLTYVRVYEALAETLDVAPLDLWRSLWRHPHGEVREHFVASVVAAANQPMRGGTLLKTADRLFATGELDFPRLPAEMRRMWREALK